MQSDDGMITIWVKSWSEIIADCKARMRFIQDKLEANIDSDSSLKYLKKTYSKYLEGVAEEHTAHEEFV